MSRIAATFEALRAQGRKGLVPYVMAGDPYADARPRSCSRWPRRAPT